MMERRKFDADFKRRIVEMVLLKGCTHADVGRDYGIARRVVSRWVGEYQKRTGWARTAEKLADDTENAALKREVRDLKSQLEFLKKTAAYFASLGKS